MYYIFFVCPRNFDLIKRSIDKPEIIPPNHNAYETGFPLTVFKKNQKLTK